MRRSADLASQLEGVPRDGDEVGERRGEGVGRLRCKQGIVQEARGTHFGRVGGYSAGGRLDMGFAALLLVDVFGQFILQELKLAKLELPS